MANQYPFPHCRIQAIKRTDEKTIVACEIDDPDAFEFRVTSVGAGYSGEYMPFETFLLAGRFCAHIEKAVDYGITQAKRELATWINGGQFQQR